MTDFSSDTILGSYIEGNESLREMLKRKKDIQMKRYLVIDPLEEVPLSTDDWERSIPLWGANTKVIDLLKGMFTTDGINWKTIEIE